MAEDHAVLGVGLGCYRLNSLPYARQVYDPSMNIPLYQLAQISHNSFLLLSCETGFPGTVFFLFFIFSTLKMGRRALQIKSSLINNISLGLMTGLLGFMVSILSGPNIMNHQLIMTTWMFAGWVTAMSRMRIPAATARPAVRPRSPALGNLEASEERGTIDLTQMPDPGSG